jgi:hypothetical protein
MDIILFSLDIILDVELFICFLDVDLFGSF